MKAQKLGLVLGMNMAAVCLVMQGCKAVKPGAQGPAPEPQPVAVTPVAPVKPAVEVVPVAPIDPVPAPVEVKPLPPPPPPKSVKPVAAAADNVYRVQKGDTLLGICKRQHVKYSAVLAANPGIKPNSIRVGQKIVMPGAPVAAEAVAASPAPKAGSVAPAAAPAVAANVKAPVKTRLAFKPYAGATKEYVVKNGDSLGKIASECGITIRALKELNGLKKDALRLGQKLKVPAEKVVAAKPAEKKADAAAKPAAPVAAPAEGAKVSVALAPEAKTAEPAKKCACAPGTVHDAPCACGAADCKCAVKKPAAEAPAAAAAAPAAAAAAPAPAPAGAGHTYVVKEGEDLVSAAIACGVSPSQLMDLNDLKAGEALKPGQVLKLPANAKVGGAQ